VAGAFLRAIEQRLRGGKVRHPRDGRVVLGLRHAKQFPAFYLRNASLQVEQLKPK
jgi:hypothetical protein